jgi:hypothetical protein
MNCNAGNGYKHSKPTFSYNILYQPPNVVLLCTLQGTMFQLYQCGMFFQHCVGGVGPLVQPAWADVVAKGWEDATREVTVSRLQRNVAHAVSCMQARPNSQVGLRTDSLQAVSTECARAAYTVSKVTSLYVLLKGSGHATEQCVSLGLKCGFKHRFVKGL